MIIAKCIYNNDKQKRALYIENINSRDEDKVKSFPIVRSKDNYGENDRNRT